MTVLVALLVRVRLDAAGVADALAMAADSCVVPSLRAISASV